MPLKARGLYFEPSDYAYVEVSNSTDLNITDEFTIFARIYVHRWGQGLRDIVVKAPGTSWLIANFRFGIGAGVNPYLQFVHGDGTNYEFWNASKLEPFRWYDVAVTNDGIYINGELDTLINISLDWYINTAPIRLGMCYGGTRRNVFHGKMCDMLFFNRKLSTTEINELRKGNVDTSDDSLLFWYPMKEGWGSKVIDYSKYGRHGTIHNARWVTERWSGLWFSKVWKSYVEVPHDDSLSLSTWTIAVIMKPRSINRSQRIIMKKDPTGVSDVYSNYGMWIGDGVLVGTYKGQLCVDVPDGVHVNRIATTVSVDVDRVGLYGYSYDGSKVRVVKDGFVEYEYNISVTPYQNTEPIRVGIHIDVVSVEHFWFSGVIRSVLIWNKPLTDDEWLQLYLHPDNPPAKENLVLWLPITERRGNIVFDRSGRNNHGVIYNARWL